VGRVTAVGCGGGGREEEEGHSFSGNGRIVRAVKKNCLQFSSGSANRRKCFRENKMKKEKRKKKKK
jgi:hypothetical protein